MDQNELYHHGVKGMKWGRRKAVPVSAERSRMLNAKSSLKSASKQYNRDFNSAYNKSHQAYSFSKKKREANNDRWETASKSAEKLRTAQKDYKEAKKAYHHTDEYKTKRDKAIKTGAAIVGTTLAAYGAYKVSKYIGNKKVIDTAKNYTTKFAKTPISRMSEVTRTVNNAAQNTARAAAQLAEYQRMIDRI